MKKKVGIPRCLLYYNYYTVYETFFREIGAEIVLSNPANITLEKGLKLVPDEVCLPIKNCFGHILDLKEKNTDFIFLPRFMRVEKHTTFCPKIIGLPDLVKNIIPNLPPLIELDINFSKKIKFYNDINNIGGLFNSGLINNYRAWKMALKDHHAYRNSLTNKKILPSSFVNTPAHQLNIAVVGHPYNIYDPNLNLDLMDKLKKKNVAIYTPDMIPMEIIMNESNELPKRIFWTLSRDIVGASKYFIKHPDIDGIINIASFACGPDSIIGELISFLVKEYGKKPYLLLILDEHTGSAGLETRIEAFIEMIRMVKDRNS
ncbi:MAG: acyl-CoA dehydratase activase-related protein [bacterium]|nr:acyl-CoA dehydratase activase-related protein [bacterium]